MGDNAATGQFRALCDNGSQVNLVTERVIQQLHLQMKRSKTSFVGVDGQTLGSSLGAITLGIQLPTGETLKTSFFVMKTITTYQPSFKRNTAFEFLQLADDKYHSRGNIDILLGINVWIKIIEEGIIKNADKTAAAQRTSLGWVIYESGKSQTFIGSIQVSPTTRLEQQLERFWEIESIPPHHFQTKEERRCEHIFMTTFRRTDKGRYMLNLPFNEKVNELGKSKLSATKQFLSTERRMASNREFGDRYRQFMTEYESLGHMSRIVETTETGYYTPHHGVLSSKKFRVVFNASAKTSTGLTLNDTQLVGEKLQPDLSRIMTCFRKFKYGLIADIEKMYRQVLITPEHRRYQKILWRPTNNEEIHVYELNTVTYGHAAAPHCAIRALVQCANDHEKEFPNGARIVKENFYVDDMTTGGDTLNEIRDIKDEVTKLLQKGCFPITKWKGNGLTTGAIQLGDSETSSVLGLYWNLETDEFFFKTSAVGPATHWTKRKILSKTGQLFDSQGLLAPVIINAKLLIQKLWQAKSDWDQPIDETLLVEWERFNTKLIDIEHISIPRWFHTTKNSKVELHGFCDASERAYAAAVFIRAKDVNGIYQSSLVEAKTRVAPLKQISIPRLELCAAHLLMELLEKVKPTFTDQLTQTHNWSDSQIVLHWLNKPSTTLKTFVANRVSAVQERSIEVGDQWHWIAGSENPADMASRGISAAELKQSSLWWNGPTWLKDDETNWPVNIITEPTHDDEEEIQREEKAILLTLTRGPWFQQSKKSSEVNLLSAYSNWNKLIRVNAFILRAKNNFINPSSKFTGSLSAREIELATLTAIQLDQAASFPQLIPSVEETMPQMYGGLTIKWDADTKTIRINGRVQSENLSFDERNPFLLSKNGKLAPLIIQFAHQKTLHGGRQIMIQFIRQRFWIPGLRRLIKKHVHQCPTCFKQRMTTSTQLMASLPKYRTTPARAFSRVGIDYCGPVEIRSKLGRFPKIEKAYVCVFVCLVTRAVHLELVSDLTTAAFIAAFRRFISRRGMVHEVLSDNGTNFVGANNVIKTTIAKAATNLEDEFHIKWNFITPLAPHHGGIYEAAVKSAKHHLIRVIGEQKLTFEEYSTVLTQVEACLNSRPLSPLTDDETDTTALTPGHFLIGSAIVMLPEEADLTDVKTNRLKRWELVQQMTQNFWKRWHSEYIMTLVNRSKWASSQRNIQRGDLVIVREDNQPPTRWKMARVIETFPASDGLIRSVKIRTSKGEYNRPITKLGLLVPAHEGEAEA